jgi:hypothetical protein
MGIQPKNPTSKGPAEWFTGDVWIDRIVEPHDQSQLNVGAVHFTPGARTARAPAKLSTSPKLKGSCSHGAGRSSRSGAGDVPPDSQDHWRRPHSRQAVPGRRHPMIGVDFRRRAL